MTLPKTALVATLAILHVVPACAQHDAATATEQVIADTTAEQVVIATATQQVVAAALEQRGWSTFSDRTSPTGKTWREADGDVCEAIDFCEYYARMAVGLFRPTRLGRFVGELDEQFHQPRGVAVVVSPWNFPLAICCGMTAAALVTGNAVIVKPAEQTPGIAAVMCELLWQAGAPRDALQLLPGPGEVVGARLVRNPRVAVIAFTGSKAVGLDIVEAAGVTPPEQPFVKNPDVTVGGLISEKIGTMGENIKVHRFARIEVGG